MFQLDRITSKGYQKLEYTEIAAVIQVSNPHIFPVSFAQERLLFLEQLDPGTSAYNLTRVIRMVGQLDAGALAQTLDKIAKRHATLRIRLSTTTSEFICPYMT